MIGICFFNIWSKMAKLDIFTNPGETSVRARVASLVYFPDSGITALRELTQEFAFMQEITTQHFGDREDNLSVSNRSKHLLFEELTQDENSLLMA